MIQTLPPEKLYLGRGAFTGVPAEIYHRLDAISASGLTLLQRSPAHYRHRLDNPEPSTPAQLIGECVHLAVLEPILFETRVVSTPHSSRTNAYKALREECEADGRLLLSQDDHDTVRRVRDAVLSHPAAAPVLARSGAYRELTILFEHDDVDRATGVVRSTHLAKARLDLVDLEGGHLVDLKTTRDASKEEFERAVYSYGYFRQLAFYRCALSTLFDVEEERQALDLSCVIVAAEREPPYAVAVYELDELALSVGWRQCEALLARYARCVREDRWPGYGDDVQALTLPTWALSRLGSPETAEGDGTSPVEG